MLGDPDALVPAGNAPHHLVHGIGRPVCPGRPPAARTAPSMIDPIPTGRAKANCTAPDERALM